MALIFTTNNNTMITQKVQIEGKEYEVSAATYKMLQEAVDQLKISVKNYNLVKEELAPPVATVLAPKPVPARKGKKK